MTFPHSFLSGPASMGTAQPDKNETGTFLSGPASVDTAQPDKNGVVGVR